MEKLGFNTEPEGGGEGRGPGEISVHCKAQRIEKY